MAERDERDVAKLVEDGLRGWLCLIRAAVKLGLQIILQQIKSTVT